jgi:hypothetical protein
VRFLSHLAVGVWAKKNDLRRLCEFAQNMRGLSSTSHTEVAMSVSQVEVTKNPVPPVPHADVAFEVEGDRRGTCAR